MSNKESNASDKKSSEDQVPDLTSLDFGPAWAREDKSRQKSSRSDEGSVKRSKSPRHAKGKRDDARAGKGRRHGGGKAPYGKRRNDRDRPPQVSPAEGVSARIMPIEEGIDGIAKEISATGRTHSVFDLAWLVLGALERFHVIFENKDEVLYKSNKDHSVWLTKQDCLRHFWSSGLVKEYYDESVTEGEAPTGNFQSVARCGLSGKLIGPPNHHSYQQVLLDLHRERFSNMPLERYKSKIKMEHGEEVVAQWMEQEKQQLSWQEKPLAEIENTPKPKVDHEVSENEEKNPSDDQPEADHDLAEDSASDVPSVDDTRLVFKTRREVEQHFLAHGFSKAYYAGKTVSTPANIPAKLIAPGLLATMRNAVSEEKRYPGKLASFLCRQMTGRHLAVFKWKKRLHCGPARPKFVPDDMVMADRPSKLFHWVLDNPSGSIDKMWQDCLPADIDDETRHAWYHDLHWLINEGLVLLFSDGKLHAAKELKQSATDKSSSKKNDDSQQVASKEQPEELEKVDKPVAEEPSPEPTDSDDASEDKPVENS